MTTTLIPPSHVLDLRTIVPRERHPLIFGRFDALAIGEAIQLVNDHNPTPLHFQFEDRAPRQFEWTTLEAGPAKWRIQITRVAAASGPAAGARGGSCCSGGACCG